MLAPEPQRAARADVCLVLEGTYPYVSGGVSSWVHDLVRSLPELTFSLFHIGPQPGVYGGRRYQLPSNVTGLDDYYCNDTASLPEEHTPIGLHPRIRALGTRPPRTRSRTLDALRRLHLEDTVDDALIDDLAAADASVEDLLHGDEAFELICDVARERAPQAPFLEFFWHFRSMHVPLLRLLAAPTPRADVYHSVSTGYAGVVSAAASRRTGRPMLLTEHGIYAREREMELSHATWVGEAERDDRMPRLAPSPLRRFWSHFFVRLSRIAYHQATRIVTLSEVNRTKQVSDGADPTKTAIVPNGIDVDALVAALAPSPQRGPDRPMRVGFVGRVVPIKDVLTFIKACSLALSEVPLEIDVIGPTEEDPAYAARCRDLVEALGRTDQIRFVGPKHPSDIYSNLDVCVLTSFSEGQPLVILEAHAAAIPVIATDVGACREMLEGTSVDRVLGPGGIITRVGAAEETAAALVRLVKSPDLRRRMGQAGRTRVRASYTKSRLVEAYRGLYRDLARAG